MEIAILGGTGDVGEGLALRWAFHSAHGVLVGSREAEKAGTKAEEYATELDGRGIDDPAVEGLANGDAAARADVVVLAVPPYHVADTIESVADGLEDGDVLVSPATGVRRDDDGFHYHRPDAGSVTRIAQGAAPEGVAVVGAYHNLAAGRLANLDADLGIDTLLVADDEDAKDLVRSLTEAIDGLRPLDAGGVADAAEIEALTPLLINVAQQNDGMHDLGVRFT